MRREREGFGSFCGRPMWLGGPTTARSIKRTLQRPLMIFFLIRNGSIFENLISVWSSYKQLISSMTDLLLMPRMVQPWIYQITNPLQLLASSRGRDKVIKIVENREEKERHKLHCHLVPMGTKSPSHEGQVNNLPSGHTSCLKRLWIGWSEREWWPVRIGKVLGAGCLSFYCGRRREAARDSTSRSFSSRDDALVPPPMTLWFPSSKKLRLLFSLRASHP